MNICIVHLTNSPDAFIELSKLLQDFDELNFMFQSENIDILRLIQKHILHDNLKNIKFYEENDCTTSTHKTLYSMLSKKSNITNIFTTILFKNDSLDIYQHKNNINYIYGLWDITPLPDGYVNIINNNKKYMMNNEISMSNKNDIVSIMNNYFKDIFDKIPRKVCLADIARYFVMQKHGGFYFDLDIVLNNDLNSFIDVDNHDVILFLEHDYYPPQYLGERENKDYIQRVYNCIFWSKPNHPFFHDCIELCRQRVEILFKEKNSDWTDMEVLWATGPDVTTTIWNSKYKGNERIKVISAIENRQYFKHLCTGTWRDKKDT